MNTAKTGRYRIADLLLDSGQRRVWRGNDEIELPKLSFDLLLALIQAAPNSLSTDELMDEVWEGAVVSPATVAKRVELLRHTIGDESGGSRYVALVRGHGYRLIPAVSDADASSMPFVRRSTFVLAAVIAIMVAWFALQPDRLPPEKSVAVLPFASMSTDIEDEHFADGLTEELSHTLARMGDLKVSGRTSSFYYKDRNEDLRDIGKALGVAHLLEGSVRRDGDTVRVTAQLISAEDGFHLWSETYDRPMHDLLQIQQDIARTVAGRLRSSLASGRTVNRTHTSSNPEAYAMYLKAVSLSPYPFGPDMPKAQELLEQVVEMDPGFAAAWNLLAAIHGRRMINDDPSYELSPQEGMRTMHEAIAKAQAIDPNLGENFANLGGIAWAFEHDPAKAAPLIEKAVELDPWNLDIVAFAANFATYIGRYEEALALEELLIERDPLCDTCRRQLASSYSYTRRFQDAEREFLTLRTVHDGGYNWSLGVIKLHQGNPQEALRYFEQQKNLLVLGQLGRAMALHDIGDRDAAAALMADAADRRGADAPMHVVQAYAYIGDLDNAFSWLQITMQTDPRGLIFNFPAPLFDNLRDDPRWHALTMQLGIAPEQLAKIPFTLDTVLQRDSLE